MQPIVYSSLDAGAPQLSLTAGVLNTVLKGCLVTGYGDKPAAGWEIAHEDMAKSELAIRSTNPQSIKSVLLLNDTNKRETSVTAYTGWDDVTKKGLNQYSVGVFKKAWYLNYNADWIVMATDRFFYLAISYGTGYESAHALAGFGDVISYKSGLEVSVMMAHKSGTGYGDADTGQEFVGTSLGVPASFASYSYPKRYRFLGDGSKSSDVYRSDLAVFCPHLLHISIDGFKQPLLRLPGLLMPFSEIKAPLAPSAYFYTYTSFATGDVIGINEVWSGCIWISTDDWG